MARAAVRMSLLAVLLLLAGLPGRAAAQGCDAYATLQEWNGRLHYTWSADYTVDTTAIERRHDASVSLHLLRQTANVPGINPIVFEGAGDGTASIHDRFTDTTTGDVTAYDGSGTPIHSAGQGGINLTVDVVTCEYSFFWSVNVDGTVTTPDGTSSQTLGLGKLQVDRRPLADSQLAPIHDGASLKARGLLWLTQGLPDDAYITFGDIDDPPGSAATDWSLVPGPAEDDELIVTIPAYDTWLPEGGPDERTAAAGKELEIRGTVQKVGGGTPQFPPQSIQFTLLSRSSEPGVAMNFPQESKLESPAPPDLRFDPTLNLPKQLEVPDPDGATARTLAPPPDGKATSLLSTYDWGGYGILQVTAVAADGTSLVGMLDTDRSKTEIEIPKRTLPSQVADTWKSNEGVPDGTDDLDDSETEPQGDGDPGDGLSLYEEYRGFVLNGTHSRKSANDALDPLQKDVFIRNCIGAYALGGIARFRKGTGLRVHAQILDGELPTGKECPGDVDFPDSERVINFNSSSGTHLVDEHAIVLIQNPAADANQVRADSPGLPRQVNRVVIADDDGVTPSAVPGGEPILDADERARYARTVAHELGHSVNIWHHGESDLGDVEWREVNGILVEQGIAYQPDGSHVPTGGAIQIFVLTEAQVPFTAEDLGLPDVFYVGSQQGQHSGHEDCFMRYESAEAFVPASVEPTPLRYWVGSETAGGHLCQGREGTGVNSSDPGARPQPPGPRYGDADAAHDRGRCFYQVRVNDELPDKSRAVQASSGSTP